MYLSGTSVSTYWHLSNDKCLQYVLFFSWISIYFRYESKNKVQFMVYKYPIALTVFAEDCSIATESPEQDS